MAHPICCYASTVRRVAGEWLFEGFVKAPLFTGYSIRFRRRKYSIDENLCVRIQFKAANRNTARIAGNRITALLDMCAYELEQEIQVRANKNSGRMLALMREAVGTLDQALAMEAPALRNTEYLLMEMAACLVGMGDRSHKDIVVRSRARWDAPKLVLKDRLVA